MKKITTIISFLALCFPLAGAAQADSVSVYILKRMAANIQGAQAVSFDVATFYDVAVDGMGYVKHGDRSTVRISAPNKFLVERSGDKGEQLAVYDGSKLQVYNMASNTYSKTAMKGSVVQVMHLAAADYGMEFPAGDFFYPAFVNDALSASTALSYIGMTEIEGQRCFHIVAVGSDMIWQLWVSADALTLPVRMVITYTEVDGNPQYQADYRNWNFSQTSNAIFNFTPVPGAKEVKMKKVTPEK